MTEGEGPKLYTNKPKKSQLKARASSPLSSSSSSSSMASSSSSSQPPPSPPPPKESFARRYKFVWPLLLAVNFSIGAYLFMRTKKKDVPVEEREVPHVPAASVTTTSAPATTAPIDTVKASSPPTIVEPAKLREPIPESRQRELFKWILEEKRKVKPKDPEEKKRIDEEKAILKQFIRAKPIPSL